MVERITITLSHQSYDIVIGEQLLASLGTYLKPVLASDRVVVVSDNQVARFWLHPVGNALEAEGITCQSLIIPAGEESKKLRPFTSLLESLLELKPDRQTAVIALGGGVVGDMAGFAAAIALRGLPYIQIPTSLLAQVDSAVGGKTAVNSRYGKNLIGSFYQPRLVLSDITTLSTLPERQLKAGYAEILKYALIGDKAFFEWLEKNGTKILEKDSAALIHAIKTSCQAKATIVMEDEKEQGNRALLNFGHTFAHALEAETGMGSMLLHGEAVACGMLLAFETSVALGLCPKDELTRLQSHYVKMGLPASLKDIAHPFVATRLMEQFSRDKKVKNQQPAFILTNGIGQTYIEKAPDMQAISQILVKACGNG